MPTYTEDLTETGVDASALSAWDISLFSSTSGNATDQAAADWALAVLESFSVGVTETLNQSAVRSVSETALIHSSMASIFQQLVDESASGTVVAALGTAVKLAEIGVATGVYATKLDAARNIAELVIAIGVAAQVFPNDILEEAGVADTLDVLVSRYASIIEATLAESSASNSLLVVLSTEDTAELASLANTQAALGALAISEAIGFINITIGGDTFTGWVLNTNTNALSEYQGLAFNSMAKHGASYYGAAEDGIYLMGGDTDAGSDIVAYLKTGKLDFGSDYHKRIHKAYLAYNAMGDVRLKTITSEAGKILEYWYTLTDTPTMETPETRRLGIGLGLKSRYWQFELVATDDVQFDEIGLLPVVLSRRI